MKNFSRAKSNQPSITANFNGLLNAGLVIYAWVHRNGIRVVSIEDIDAIYLNNEPTRRHAHFIGKGTNIEVAFKKALAAYVKGKPQLSRLPWQKQSQKVSLQTSGKLDQWLYEHKGTLRAVKDEDGKIICILKGRADAFGLSAEQVNLVGTGLNLYSALKAALDQAK